ncbi:MAG: class I SAM-dependent methyltransferase [Casimicrobiaceae bacterium]
MILDHGAGSATEKRTAVEMETGVAKIQIVGDVCTIASKPPAWGEMLFKLVRYSRSTNCIEMGTCLGISAAYIGTALKLNGGGRLVTLEGAATLAEIAKSNLGSLQLGNTTVTVGNFSKTLGPALSALRPIDFMFIDGHHDRDATLRYFEQARPFLAPKNVVVFDDIDWSDGMREAWAQIKQETQGYALGNVGLCLNVN